MSTQARVVPGARSIGPMTVVVAAGRSSALKDAVTALSLSNLCFLKLWAGLLSFTRAEMFFMKAPPTKHAIAAGLVNTFLLGLVLWFALRVARRRRAGLASKAATGLIVLAALVFANAVRETLSSALPLPFLRFQMVALLGFRGTALFLAAVVCAVVASGFRYQRTIAVWVAPVLYGCFAFVPFTLGYAAWSLTRDYTQSFAEPPPASRLPSTLGNRVVWILFDEWDQRLSFDDRPAGLALPELDRLRAVSVSAEDAEPPADQTALSVPSLLSGRLVIEARPTGPDSLVMRFADSDAPVKWGTEPSLLSDARRFGRTVAIVGWYLPYCRVLANLASECAWMELPAQSNSMGERFADSFPNQLRSLLETGLLSPFGQSLAVRRHVRNYEITVNRAIDVASDQDIGLTFIHLPSAHVPYFYDRLTGGWDAANSLVSGYSNGLALTDWTLGRIRAAMEKQGVWDGSTVLVSSDHSFRQSRLFDGKTDHRVPFLLKAAGQRRGFTYRAHFNTVLSAGLLRSAMEGELRTAEDIRAWIDRHRRGLQPRSAPGTRPTL